MVSRIAAAMSMLVFALCVAAGTAAGNPFGTIVQRALLAMLATLVIGLIVGAMAQKMLDENLRTHEELLKKDSVASTEDGR